MASLTFLPGKQQYIAFPLRCWLTPFSQHREVLEGKRVDDAKIVITLSSKRHPRGVCGAIPTSKTRERLPDHILHTHGQSIGLRKIIISKYNIL